MKKLRGILLSALLLSVVALILAACSSASYTVTFDGNGGAGTAPAITVTGGTCAVAPDSPQKAGEFFAGWWTEKNGGEQWLFEKNTVDKDLTLYAHYTGTAYSVSFDLNGHGETAPSPQAVAKNQYAVQPESPKEDGYAFKGWYTDAAGTNEWDFSAGKIQADATLYAKWNETVQLTFEAEEGKSKVLTVEKGALPPASQADERVGYAFGGWYEDREARIPLNMSKPITENKTVYANWLREADESCFTYKDIDRYGDQDAGVYITRFNASADVETLVIPKMLGGKKVSYINLYGETQQQAALPHVKNLVFHGSIRVLENDYDRGIFPNLMNYIVPSPLSGGCFSEDGILYQSDTERSLDPDTNTEVQNFYVKVVEIPRAREGIVALSPKVNRYGGGINKGQGLLGVVFTGKELRADYAQSDILYFVKDEYFDAYQNNSGIEESFRNAMYSDAYLREDAEWIGVPYRDEHGTVLGKRLVAYVGESKATLTTPDYLPRTSTSPENRVTAVAGNVIKEWQTNRLIVSAGVNQIGAYQPMWEKNDTTRYQLRLIEVLNEDEAVALEYLAAPSSLPFYTVAPQLTLDEYPDQSFVPIVPADRVVGDFIFTELQGYGIGVRFYIGVEKDVVVPPSVVFRGNTVTVTSVNGDGYRPAFPRTTESLTIPAELASMSADHDIPNLARIAVDGDSAYFYATDNVLYSKYSSENSLFLYPAKRAGETFIVPSDVTSIGWNAFKDCSLKRVTMGSNVKSFGSNVFWGFKAESFTLELTGPKPPEVGYNLFGDYEYQQKTVRIEVPADALAAYKGQWTDYSELFVGV